MAGNFAITYPPPPFFLPLLDPLPGMMVCVPYNMKKKHVALWILGVCTFCTVCSQPSKVQVNGHAPVNTNKNKPGQLARLLVSCFV